MNLIETEISGVVLIENSKFIDDRGEFVKFFHQTKFKEFGLFENFKESYYSVSHKDVIRGMHFQLPPYDHEKLVFVPKGKILDVILDLRVGLKTYGETVSFVLSEDNNFSVYIPKGFAHGFKSLEEGTIVVYNVATEYSPENDCGIRWDSFCFDWNLDNAIISDKDKKLISLEDFNSPF